ncbi:sulfatase family protein [Carboxylicivirga marina]|uniref:Sulfatase n=1 Tax=Carboxylicivirga marina TaxID=2800988 RepID=A0ABS1HIK8_9BACT|nr:sulfatase [Carboxylicivirga marina]MBK3517508.1 sulfatase [Carboxylicivirga marina]
MRQVRILQLGMLVLLVSSFSCKTAKQAKREVQKPNILYIMSDDHTSQGFGVYGSRLASLNPTPTIDRLAHEGILFENAFCTNAICTPSRATIMTGQYSQANGVQDLDGNLPEERQYLAHEMKKLGYQTAVIGKWHLKKTPAAFDYYNVLYGQGDYFDPVLAEKGSSDSIITKFHGKKGLWPGKQYEGHSSDVITDLSLEWLKNKRDKDKPFFLMHHFKAPHDMFEFAPRYADYLEDVTIPEPESLWDNKNNGSVGTRGYNDSLLDTIGSSVGHRNIIRNMGMHMKIDQDIPDPEYKRLAYQEYLKRYLRCVKGVDDNVKRLFDYMEAEGLMENTIIIYTGDQGFMLGEHDYIDKRWMYEESLRMPFLVRYPEMIKAGTRTDAIINNADFAPTIIDLAGGKAPEYMQGESFVDILPEGKEPEGWKQATYYRYWMHMAHKHSNPAHFGIRTKDYKLILFYGLDYMKRGKKPKGFSHNPASMSAFQTPLAWEFYDLKKDPKEMDNRYDDPAYADVISSLKQQLKQMRTELNEGDEKYPQIQALIEANW